MSEQFCKQRTIGGCLVMCGNIGILCTMKYEISGGVSSLRAVHAVLVKSTSLPLIQTENSRDKKPFSRASFQFE